MSDNILNNVRFNAGKRTKREKFRLLRFIFRLVGVLLLIVISFTFVASYYVYKKYSPIVEGYYDYACEVAESSTIADFKSKQTSYIYNSRGKQIAKLKTDRDVNYLGYDSFPDDVINALVAVEDKRFGTSRG